MARVLKFRFKNKIYQTLLLGLKLGIFSRQDFLDECEKLAKPISTMPDWSEEKFLKHISMHYPSSIALVMIVRHPCLLQQLPPEMVEVIETYKSQLQVRPYPILRVLGALEYQEER